ncbi:S9 family peptidase [Novosphingobium sp. 9U]|uniref:alpha/beta hydrolase family protein n=1 Tax=Novosphingobium sp. 9U TaxID=2653158 RepID=UPI0012F29F74|nr:S9 family peptidase [Novosphingobium sp. 9U]VWX52130.1 Peptidase S9 [Novosphingobium sp. 9U]
MKMKRFALALAGAALVPYAAMAQESDLAARFGAMPGIQDISISPNGNKIAIIAPTATGQALLVVDRAGDSTLKSIMRADRKDGQLTACVWSTDQRIVCTVHGIINDAGLLLGYTRNLAIDADGTKLVKLTARDSLNAQGTMQNGGTVLDWDVAQQPGTVLVSRQFVPDRTTGSYIGSDAKGLGVEALDTVTLRRTIVERARQDAVEYISDGHGAIRIVGSQAIAGTGYLSGRVRYSYRPLNSREWAPLSIVSVEGEGQGFNPYAVDSGKNVVYGFDDKDGYQALYSIALDPSLKKELVLARPDVDIDGLIRIGRDARVVGASYATERRTTEYFDPELRKLSAALGKALPGQPLVNIVDASDGESKLLIVAASDTNPGMVYLYDKASRKLEEILPMRSAVDGLTLAPMKHITYKAADGTSIPAYLTLPVGSTGKGLPAIVMPHGGPSSRDEWGFDWLVQFYAARGYAVIQPNYRGSSGYGSAWYQKNGFQSWRVAVGDVNDAGRWLVAQGIAAPDKLAAVGWSYGGYAALQSAVLDPDLFKAIVAIAPVTDLERWRQEASQYTSGALVSRFIGQGPHVREGSPAQNARAFKAPVLMFHGDLDQNVGIGESRLMRSSLQSAGKEVTLVEFTGLDHQLEDAAARKRLLSESDAFLRKNLGL